VKRYIRVAGITELCVIGGKGMNSLAEASAERKKKVNKKGNKRVETP